MALPDSNISTTLVGTTLGSSSRNVGTLCTHENINKWSKWKPVPISNKITGVTVQDLAGVQFGLEIPFFSTRQDLINYYESGSIVWNYSRPTGGPQYPYRIGDFRNYEHLAQRFYNVIIPETVIGTGGVTIEMGHLSVSGGLTWADFTGLDLNNIRFGATASNNQTVVENEPIISDNVGYVTIPTTNSITSYAFLALVSETNPSNILRYYALEGGTGFTEYMASAINVEMNNSLITMMDRVMSQLTLTNIQQGGSTVLTGVSIQVRYGDKSPTDSLEFGEATQSFGNITVVYGTPEIRNHTFNNVLQDYSTRGGYVYFQCASHPQLNQIFGLSIS